MERVTFRMTEREREELDELVDRGIHASRSEAIRHAVKEHLDSHARNLSRRSARRWMPTADQWGDADD